MRFGWKLKRLQMGDPPGHVAIVGASLAGAHAATGLRSLGYKGIVTLIGDELHPPYDRPPLSKSIVTDNGEPDIPALPFNAEKLDIQLLTGLAATALDRQKRTISLADGRTVNADAIILATGAHPRRLPFGKDLRGVHYLRTWDDAIRIRQSFRRAARVVIVGGGFVGAEVAAAARAHDLKVAIIDRHAFPFEALTGPVVGALLRSLHQARGVEIISAASVEALLGENRVEQVVLTDGSSIPADVVIIGIGVDPATGWLESSGLNVHNGVLCNEVGAVERAEQVYAAGDVASWRNPITGRHHRNQHWTGATEQARVVVRSILGQTMGQPGLARVPYFWSDQYGLKLQMAGYFGPETSFEVVEGKIDDLKFTGTFTKDGAIVGAATMNSPRSMAAYRQLLTHQHTAPLVPGGRQ